MLNELTAREMELGPAIEQALVDGDLSGLSLAQRLDYYKAVCQSLSLNPLTKPFIYIELWNDQKKRKVLTLYPTGNCADQLRAIHNVNIERLEKKLEDGIYEVTAYAALPNGRKDQATGFVWIEKLVGADKANAKMKAETKAKRRVTFSIVGLSGVGGVDLPDDDDIKFRDVDTDHSPTITAREEQVKAEHAMRPAQEWAEELDVPFIESNNAATSAEPPAPVPGTQPLSQPIHVPSKAAPAATFDSLQDLENLVAKHTAAVNNVKAEIPEPAMKRYRQEAGMNLSKTALGDEEMRHAWLLEVWNRAGLTVCNAQELMALRDWSIRPHAKVYLSAWVDAYIAKHAEDVEPFFPETETATA